MSGHILTSWVGDECCESNNHNWKARPVAAFDAAVMLAPGIFAHILLCRGCADTLRGATDSAGG